MTDGTMDEHERILQKERDVATVCRTGWALHQHAQALRAVLRMLLVQEAKMTTVGLGGETRAAALGKARQLLGERSGQTWRDGERLRGPDREGR